MRRRWCPAPGAFELSPFDRGTMVGKHAAGAQGQKLIGRWWRRHVAALNRPGPAAIFRRFDGRWRVFEWMKEIIAGVEVLRADNPEISAHRAQPGRHQMARITLRQLLDHAAEHEYGVPAFNINNMEQALAT
jgi:hypothetical protein